MIEVFTGFVGSGKSYHATYIGCQLADAPKGDREVIANFPIKPKRTFLSRIPIIKNRVEKFNSPRWHYWDNDEMTPKRLVQFSYEWKQKHNLKRVPEGQFLLIIDEAGIVFNSRDWNVAPSERKEWIKFFTQSRKLGYDVIMIVQDVRMLDRQIRSLAEYEVQHKKLNNWSFFRFLPFTLFAAVKFWNGARYARGSLTLRRYKRKIAERYDTAGLFGYGDEYLNAEG